jgi:hypothetical protein
MDSENQLVIDLVNKLKTSTDFEVEDVHSMRPSPPLDTVDIEMLFRIKDQSEMAAMLVATTESSVILRDKMRQIKVYAQRSNQLPFIGGRFFGEGDRNLAMVEGVNLFDLAGNVYLNTPQVHYEVKVTKNPFADKPTLKEVFSPVSSRLIRVLLASPDKEWGLVALAKEAGVSVGLAYKIITKLVEDKLVDRGENKVISIKSPGEILDRWVRTKNSYPSYTQQKYGFYSLKKIPAILEAITTYNNDKFMKYALSFSTGAYLVAPYLTELNKVQMYINHSVDIDTWKRILDLTPVDRGANVEIYVPYDKGVFYGTQQVTLGQGNDKINVVSNVQIYLDVIGDPARGEEQAEHLRKLRLHY